MEKNQTVEKKIATIFELEEAESLSVSDWDFIKNLIFDNDPEVRLRISELLAVFPGKESENLLIQMLKDSDYLVRASVCDSLSFSKSPDTLRLLINSTRDKRYLVRGYAVLSIGDIQCNLSSNANTTIEFLKSLEHKETNEWVRIAVFRSLYVLGKYSYGSKLLGMLESRYYRNRCFTISLLEQLVESNMAYEIPEMKLILQQHLEVEKAYSVKMKLNHLLEMLVKTETHTKNC